MDRLSDLFRIIYYDQRGPGRSAEGVEVEDVDIRSQVEDLESVRKARAIEERLYEQTWSSPEYDLVPVEAAVRAANAIYHHITFHIEG